MISLNLLEEMKQKNYEDFQPGEFVFWQRQRDGLYVILEVQRRDHLPPLLFLERIYNTHYEKENGNRKDRQYQVDATYCKIINLKELLNFEEQRLEKVKKMINHLGKFK